MIKKFRCLLLIPILLFNVGELYAENLPKISLEELEAFEAELAKMSPEQWEAINAEIDKVINNLPPEEREKLFAEAAAEAARLEEEFEAIRAGRQIEFDTSIKTPTVEEPKQAKEIAPKVDATEKQKLLKVLNRLSDNLDDLQLMVANYPLLQAKLLGNAKWQKFMEHYYLLHSLVNSIINNSKLQDHLLQAEWDTLRAELITWDNALQLVEDIQYSDNDADISRAEATAIDKVLEDLFTTNSAENVVWSLKRMFQKYAENELKNIEKLNAEKVKQGAYKFPIARRDITTDTKGVPPRQKKQTPTKAPNIYVHKPEGGASRSAAKPEAELGEKEEDNKGKGVEKKSTGGAKGGDKKSTGGAKGGDKKSDSKSGGDKTKGGKPKDKDSEEEEKKKPLFEEPTKKFVNKLKDISKIAKDVIKDVKDLTVDISADIGGVQPGTVVDAVERGARLRPLTNQLVILSHELRNAQIDFAKFYDKDGKLNEEVAKGLAGLVGKKDQTKDNAITAAAYAFADIKDKFAGDVSSFDIVKAFDKAYGVGDKVKDVKVYYEGLIQPDIKPHDSEVVKEELVNSPAYLIADIADRLLTFSSMADPSLQSITVNKSNRLLKGIRNV